MLLGDWKKVVLWCLERDKVLFNKDNLLKLGMIGVL